MFKLEEVDGPKWGPLFSGPPGGIASVGASEYSHRFGGQSWNVVDPMPKFFGPVLVLTLDLRDPLLSSVHTDQLDEIPLCSYLGCDIWHEPQLYRVYPKEKRVVLLERCRHVTEQYAPELQVPMKEVPLRISPMTSVDYPVTEDAYWNLCDLFAGGDRFLRVLGPPLWLQDVATMFCQCGRPMKYLSSIGYENQAGKVPHSGIIPHEPLFFGEAATYWFLCADCLTIGSFIQST